MDRFPLLFDGRMVGELTAEREGLYLCFSASCRLPEKRLWSIWVIGEQNELRLGIPEPSDGEFFLRRRFSGQMIAPLGQLLRGEVRAAGSAAPEASWRPVDRPERLFRTPRLQSQLRGMRGVLADGTGKCRVAIPYDPGRPFPLEAMFCCARICRIGGKTYVVYCFDGREWPILQKN